MMQFHEIFLMIHTDFHVTWLFYEKSRQLTNRELPTGDRDATVISKQNLWPPIQRQNSHVKNEIQNGSWQSRKHFFKQIHPW